MSARRAKLFYLAVIALNAVIWFVVSLGASGSFSHAFDSALVVWSSAFFGWLHRNCDHDA